jgi:hypothetical protein
MPTSLGFLHPFPCSPPPSPPAPVRPFDIKFVDAQQHPKIRSLIVSLKSKSGSVEALHKILVYETKQKPNDTTISYQKIQNQMSCDIGLYGLAVMGQNFALNMAEHGFTVAVCNRSPDKVDTTVERAKEEGNLPLVGYKDLADFVGALKTPRKVVILVQAGKPVDETIDKLAQYMEPGDVIIDGGNEWFPNSVRRAEELQAKGILFVGMGISGGEEGAR